MSRALSAYLTDNIYLFLHCIVVFFIQDFKVTDMLLVSKMQRVSCLPYSHLTTLPYNLR